MGKLVDLYPVEHIGFENNPGFGSWRGYIWSRSFPLLKKTLLLGTGADTYCAVFPQEDYAGKYSTTGASYDIVVDKPHNMYLGAAVGTGVLSLLALLAIFGIYLFSSARIYRRASYGDDFLTFAGSGVFFGIIGFLAAALVNDSSVSVMPMFYGLLGLGIAINDKLAARS
jgi:O-antigen ligase